MAAVVKDEEGAGTRKAAPSPVLEKPPAALRESDQFISRQIPLATASASGSAATTLIRKQAAVPPPPYLRRPQAVSGGKGVAAVHNHRQRSGRSICRCRRFCCFLLLFILCSLILLTLAGAVCYLYFQPHLPSFRWQTIQASRFDATTNSDGSGSGSGTYVVNVTALAKILLLSNHQSNRNSKISLSYSGSNWDLYISDQDGDVSLGSAGSLQPGFLDDQGKRPSRSGTVLNFSAEVKGLLLDDAVGRRLTSKFRSREIRFGLDVRMRLGILLAGRKILPGFQVPIQLACPPLPLKLTHATPTILQTY